MNPDFINDLLNELLVCSCDALENGLCGDTGADPCFCPCRMFISVGPPMFDCCPDGQLSINIERIYPVSNFPAQNSQVNLCQTPLAMDVTLVLLRCAPVMDEHGNPPTHLELQAAAESLNRDMWILITGLLCCLAAKGRRQKFVFNGARQLPPAVCHGVSISLTIELNN